MSGITGFKYVTVWVRDYDEALQWYTEKLGFEVLEDEPMGPDARWVSIAPPGHDWPRIVLHKALPFQSDEEREWIEHHIGDNSGWVLSTDNVEKTHETLRANGVDFTEGPTKEDRGTYAVFEDLYGNEYVLSSTEE